MGSQISAFHRLGRLGRRLGSLVRNRLGNATLVVAMGMPAMIGAAGLAVDTAQWYLWKRELQHSVDQAALAGAWMLLRDPESDNFIERAQQEYTANQQIIGDYSSEADVRLVDYAGGTDNSVVVLASTARKLPFTGYLMGQGVNISVNAQASFEAGASYNACLVALEDFNVGGNALVRAQCGLAALDCGEDAIVIDGSAIVETDMIATCGTASVPAENEDVVIEGLQGLEDYYADVEAPDDQRSRNYNCTTSGRGNARVTQANLLPGTYDGGIQVRCTTFLQSGVYVIDGGELDLTANYDVTGNSVIFVLRNGAKVKLGGHGQGNTLNLTPMTAVDYIGTDYEDDAEKLAGMLIFEDRHNDLQGQNHLLNGNSHSLIEGTIYMSATPIQVNGTADVRAQCLQISARRIFILGNAMLETLCPTAETNSIGTTVTAVRLVA